MTYYFGKSFISTYCAMREKGERVRVFSEGRKGKGEIGL